MRPVWRARILTAVALTVQPSAQAPSSSADTPSLTITTRTTIDGVARTTTEIVRTKGSRRRVDWIDERTDGVPAPAPRATLYQCDLHRTIALFAEYRTFAADRCGPRVDGVPVVRIFG
jgi:hypothetical protein